MLRAKESAGQVGVDRVAPVRERQLRERRHLARCASIVEGHVKTAKVADRRLDQGLCQSLVSDVACDGDGIASGLLDLRDERVELRPTPRGRHDFGALLCEQLRRGVADPGACPGDDGNLVDQFGHLLTPLAFFSGAPRAST
jgi:hypothetical protein